MGFFKSISKIVRRVVSKPVKAITKSVSKVVKNVNRTIKSVNKGINTVIKRNKYTLATLFAFTTKNPVLINTALQAKLSKDLNIPLNSLDYGYSGNMAGYAPYTSENYQQVPMNDYGYTPENYPTEYTTSSMFDKKTLLIGGGLLALILLLRR